MTTPQFTAIAAACRFNTGSHFLDSGSAYGRHHERPPVQPDVLPVTLEAYVSTHDGSVDITATISLAHWLNEGFTLDEELTDAFDAFVAADDDTHGEGTLKDDWFTLGRRFMESLPYYQHARDNVYNAENDFDQVFVWEVWTPKEEESDWVYADAAVCVMYIHTGCDVRGGYGKPLFMRSKNDSYSMQLDWVASFYAESATRPDGTELTNDECHELDEKWQCGYSRNPSSRLSDDVAELIKFTEDKPTDGCTVKLKTGETVVVVAGMPYLQ